MAYTYAVMAPDPNNFGQRISPSGDKFILFPIVGGKELYLSECRSFGVCKAIQVIPQLHFNVRVSSITPEIWPRISHIIPSAIRDNLKMSQTSYLIFVQSTTPNFKLFLSKQFGDGRRKHTYSIYLKLASDDADASVVGLTDLNPVFKKPASMLLCGKFKIMNGSELQEALAGNKTSLSFYWNIAQLPLRMLQQMVTVSAPPSAKVRMVTRRRKH